VAFVLPATKHIFNVNAFVEDESLPSEKWARFNNALDVYLKISYQSDVARPQKVKCP